MHNISTANHDPSKVPDSSKPSDLKYLILSKSRSRSRSKSKSKSKSKFAEEWDFISPTNFKEDYQRGKERLIYLLLETKTLIPEDRLDQFEEILDEHSNAFNDLEVLAFEESEKRVELEGVLIEKDKIVGLLEKRSGREGFSARMRNFCIGGFFFLGCFVVYKNLIREPRPRPIEEEHAISFNYVEALAARHRGEIYIDPKNIKPESKMTAEEKKARDNEIAKEKRRIARKKKQQRKARAKERKFAKINESWDDLLDKDFEMQYEVYKKNFEERRAELEAQKKVAIERQKEAIEKEKKEKEEAEKRAEEAAEREKRQAEKLALEEAESIEKEKRRRQSWFGF